MEREVWGMEDNAATNSPCVIPMRQPQSVTLWLCPFVTWIHKGWQDFQESHSPLTGTGHTHPGIPKMPEPFCLGSEEDTEQFVNYVRRVGAKIALYQI